MNFSLISVDCLQAMTNADNPSLVIDVIKNNVKVQAIANSHREETLATFTKNASAVKMISLQTKHMPAMKSSVELPSEPLVSVLQKLLAKSEEEAMTLYQIANAHRDEALKIFKLDTPASRMVVLRMKKFRL